jgi:hypothetical protein
VGPRVQRALLEKAEVLRSTSAQSELPIDEVVLSRGFLDDLRRLSAPAAKTNRPLFRTKADPGRAMARGVSGGLATSRTRLDEVVAGVR